MHPADPVDLATVDLGLPRLTLLPGADDLHLVVPGEVLGQVVGSSLHAARDLLVGVVIGDEENFHLYQPSFTALEK